MFKKITKETRNVVLGMAIGDGCFNSGRLRILQCEKQYQYVVWKKQLLNSLGIMTSDIEKFDNSGFVAYRFRTANYNFIKHLNRELYTPKKTLSRKILNRLTPLEIAIWYMDDGGLSQKKQNGKIVANDLMLNTGLSKEENQVIIDYFKEVWDIQFSQVKNHNCYRLRCGTKDARKFIAIVKDYVLDVGCFDYKISVKA